MRASKKSPMLHRRRDGFATVGAIAATAVWLAILPASNAWSRELVSRPNVVVILADDLGWTDLGCTGSTFYRTPHLDRLAASGMTFTAAYAACPVCSPTRAALMTGRYPARVGVTDYIPGARTGKLLPADYLHQLPLEETTIAEMFQQAGYATGMFGKWHLGGSGYLPDQQGFDVMRCGDDGRGFKGVDRADQVTEPALEFLEALRERPFFLYLPHNLVHTPLVAKPELQKLHEQRAAALPKSPLPRFRPEGAREDRRVQDHAVYAAMMEDLDASVGRVLQKLEQLGIAERTIVVFTSDNGGLSTSEGSPTSNAPLRAGKGWLYEGGIRVPLLVRWPGVVQPGTHCGERVITMDLVPTLLEACGVELRPAAHCDGVSLAPALKQAGHLPKRPLYWHYPHYGNQGGSPGSAVIDADWKLIEFFEDDRAELYHLKDDPGEQKNLAASHSEQAARLRAQLAQWRGGVGAKMPKPNPEHQPGDN